MAGSPLKRQRKLGVRDEDGSVIAFPRLSHPRAGLSHAQWRALSPGEKLERLFGNTLTITFPQDVNNFFVDLYNGQIYAGMFTASDNSGMSTTVSIPPNTSSGTALISFPALGNLCKSHRPVIVI